MENSIKIKLSVYGILSCISYIYLIMQPRPGISVPIFMMIQLISIFYTIKGHKDIKNKYGIAIFIPIIIISLNYCMSGSYLFRGMNMIVITVLYSAMILMINNRVVADKMSFNFILNTIVNLFAPFINFFIPFKWIKISRNDGALEKYKIRQIICGLLISVPCVLFLFMMLSSADMIFSEIVSLKLEYISSMLNSEYLYKLIFGTFVGLYLFGHIYNVFPKNVQGETDIQKSATLTSNKIFKGDIIVINILLVSILAVYTMFVIIQFRYLFSGSELPYGLNYSKYARRGFFELVFLSILNLGLILISVYLLEDKLYDYNFKWSKITLVLLLYLCLITFILLVSSFYRMMLYDKEFGYTRLRIIVYLFLIFEASGLIATIKFIFKPNFNIILIYAFIGLIYYMTLNVIQIDNIIAKRNIDMYFDKQTESIDINYLMNLSVDAAPQIMRLLESDETDFTTKYQAKEYFKDLNMIYNDTKFSWQNYNFSIEKSYKTIQKNIEKLQ